MVGKVRWEIQIALFLIPAIIYGVMLWGQKFPKDEAGAAGVSYTDMLKQLGLPDFRRQLPADPAAGPSPAHGAGAVTDGDCRPTLRDAAQG